MAADSPAVMFNQISADARLFNVFRQKLLLSFILVVLLARLFVMCMLPSGCIAHD
jgi:uncharacterized membrane protein affecting hemolysin expression